MGTKKKDKLQEQAESILKQASEMGVKENFLFVTSFQRLLDLLKHFNELEKEIKDKGLLVTKSYVKDKENIYVNPALAAQNQVNQAANHTINILLKIIAEFKKEPRKENSKFLEFLNGNEEE